VLPLSRLVLLVLVLVWLLVLLPFFCKSANQDSSFKIYSTNKQTAMTKRFSIQNQNFMMVYDAF